MDVTGIGVVLDVSAGHAYNCVLVSEDGKVDLRMVEPQTDQWDHRAVPGYSAQVTYVHRFGTFKVAIGEMLPGAPGSPLMLYHTFPTLEEASA